MSIRSVLKTYFEKLDLAAARADPDASAVAVLLLHHADDFDEAMADKNNEAAKPAQGDIHDIVKDLDDVDFDRIFVVFGNEEEYSRFVDKIQRILEWVL